MRTFAVHFKGMLTRDERQRLASAGIEIAGSRASMRAGTEETGTVGIGRPNYTAKLEAASADEALIKVREAIEPDTSNFSGWRAEPV